MARPDPKISCARVRVLLEAYVDGDLTAPRQSRLRAHLEACFECRAELAHAARVRNALRALPIQELPEAAMAALLERARRAGMNRGLRGWIKRFGAPVWRPALATSGVAAIVVALMILARPRPHEVTQQELAHAETQIRWVMAHLGEIGRRTGVTVRNEVIEARVVRPTTQAVEDALGRQQTQ